MLRLKGYDFTFHLEKEDFIPKADFVPFVWQRKGKEGPDDNGLEEDELGDQSGQDGTYGASSTASKMVID